MIQYDNSEVIRILFRVQGSIFLKPLPVSTLTGLAGLALALIRYFEKTDEFFKATDGKYMENSFGISIFLTVLGYLLVVRTNMALRRYMDAIGDVETMVSKWADAFKNLSSFFAGKSDTPERMERILMFRFRVAHWFSLMAALGFAALRNGCQIENLDDVQIKVILGDGGMRDTTTEASTEVAESGPSPTQRRKSFAQNRSATIGSVERISGATRPSTNSDASDVEEDMSEPSRRKSVEIAEDEDVIQPSVSSSSNPTEKKKIFAANKSATFASTVSDLSRTGSVKSGHRTSGSSQNTMATAVSRKTLHKAKTMEDIGESGAKKTEELRSMDLDVLSMPTYEEVTLLDDADDKVNLISLWIVQGIVTEMRAKTLDTPPPIVTRVLQELSSGMLGYNQAFKVAMTPFPFPFAQMVSILLLLLDVTLPFGVDNFTQNIVLTPLLSFFLPLCYHGLNNTSVELEEPFGTDLNDVDIESRNSHFHGMLIDVLRLPNRPPYAQDWPESCWDFEQKIRRGVIRGLNSAVDDDNDHWLWDVLTLRTRPGEGHKDSSRDSTRQSFQAEDSQCFYIGSRGTATLSDARKQPPAPRNILEMPPLVGDLAGAANDPGRVDSRTLEAYTWEEESTHEEMPAVTVGHLSEVLAQKQGTDCCGTAVMCCTNDSATVVETDVGLTDECLQPLAYQLQELRLRGRLPEPAGAHAGGNLPARTQWRTDSRAIETPPD